MRGAPPPPAFARYGCLTLRSSRFHLLKGATAVPPHINCYLPPRASRLSLPVGSTPMPLLLEALMPKPVPRGGHAHASPSSCCLPPRASRLLQLCPRLHMKTDSLFLTAAVTFSFRVAHGPDSHPSFVGSARWRSLCSIPFPWFFSAVSLPHFAFGCSESFLLRRLPSLHAFLANPPELIRPRPNLRFVSLS